MSDELEPETAPEIENEPKSLKPWLIGGAAAVLAAVGIGYASSRDSTDWSKDNVAANTQQSGVEENLAATPESEPEPEPDVRGVIKPKNESTIASKITARITAMPYGKGRSFRRGALLARFDCSGTQAQLKAAQAAAAAYDATYKTNVELDEYEAIGKNEVAVSKANLGKARAEANAVRAQLSDCAVYAPFSGTVVEQIGHRGEIAASGQPLLTIQSGGNLEVELIVPSNWLTWLRPGANFTFNIDETGNSITGQVTRLGASVDPVSKTIRITGSVDKTDGLVLPGMSGTALIEKPVDKPADKPDAASTEGEKPAAKPAQEQSDGRTST